MPQPAEGQKTRGRRPLFRLCGKGMQIVRQGGSNLAPKGYSFFTAASP